MERTATQPDVVIVGAGIVGCSVAYELARSGRRVTVVDAGPGAGAGSTSASSAIVRFNYSTHTGVATAWESLHGWLGWTEHLGAGPAEALARYHRTGGLLLDAPGVPSRRIEDLFHAVGVPFQTWDAETLHERMPSLDLGRHHPPKRVDDPDFWGDPDGRVGGCFTPDAGFVDDPALAAQNLRAAAERHGAAFRFRQRVTAVVRDGGRAAGVQLAGGTTVRAGIVVNAAGPASRVVNDLAGVLEDFAVSTRPLRQEVHQIPAPDDYQLGRGLHPFVADPDLGTYFRPAPGGGVLLGGLEPECDPFEWLDDPDVYDPSATGDVYEAQTLRVARRLPSLRVPPRPSGLAGVYDVSDDWTPIYDRTSLDGYYVAIGTSGNQFKNAPVIGLLLRALIDEVEAGRDHDAEPVSVLLPRTGITVDLGAYSRLRALNSDSTFSVLG
jgi:sarcosine oxidase subunit beta